MYESDGTLDGTLTEAELIALREQIAGTSVDRSREIAPDGKLRDVVRYDLVNHRGAGEGRLPTLDIVYERFAGLLSEALGRLAGVSVSVRPQTAASLKFADCNAAMPSPFAMQVLELSGLRGSALLGLDPNVLFHLIDLLLGGTPSKPVDAGALLLQRGMTAVERRLFAHLIRLFATEMTTAWEGVAPIAIRPVRAEIEPKHAAVFDATEMVVQAIFHIETGNISGDLRFVLPQSAIKPIEKKLASGLVDAGADNQEDWGPTTAAMMLEVGVLCTAELGHTTMTVLDLLRLQVGSVIRLDRDPDSEIMVFVEGDAKFAGAIEVTSGNFCVAIQRRIEPDPAKTDPGKTDPVKSDGPDAAKETVSATHPYKEIRP